MFTHKNNSKKSVEKEHMGWSGKKTQKPKNKIVIDRFSQNGGANGPTLLATSNRANKGPVEPYNAAADVIHKVQTREQREDSLRSSNTAPKLTIDDLKKQLAKRGKSLRDLSADQKSGIKKLLGTTPQDTQKLKEEINRCAQYNNNIAQCCDENCGYMNNNTCLPSNNSTNDLCNKYQVSQVRRKATAIAEEARLASLQREGDGRGKLDRSNEGSKENDDLPSIVDPQSNLNQPFNANQTSNCQPTLNLRRSQQKHLVYLNEDIPNYAWQYNKDPMSLKDNIFVGGGDDDDGLDARAGLEAYKGKDLDQSPIKNAFIKSQNVPSQVITQKIVEDKELDHSIHNEREHVNKDKIPPNTFGYYATDNDGMLSRDIDGKPIWVPESPDTYYDDTSKTAMPNVVGEDIRVRDAATLKTRAYRNYDASSEEMAYRGGPVKLKIDVNNPGDYNESIRRYVTGEMESVPLDGGNDNVIESYLKDVIKFVVDQGFLKINERMFIDLLIAHGYVMVNTILSGGLFAIKKGHNVNGDKLFTDEDIDILFRTFGYVRQGSMYVKLYSTIFNEFLVIYPSLIFPDVDLMTGNKINPGELLAKVNQVTNLSPEEPTTLNRLSNRIPKVEKKGRPGMRPKEKIIFGSTGSTLPEPFSFTKGY